MNILEVFGEPISNGGQESFVVNVLSHLDNANMKIDLLTPYYCDNSYYESIVNEKGGNIYKLGLDFNPGRLRNSIYKPLVSFLECHRYDVVHIHSGSISVLEIVSRAAKKNGVKRVITHSHCGIEKKTIKNTILRYVAMFIMRKNVDVFCACSYEAALAKYPKKYADKALIVKNGVDTELYRFNQDIRDTMRNKLNIRGNTVVIGHVGRFNYQKNHELLVDIFKAYHEQYRDSILLMIGSGELQEKIKEKVKSLKIDDAVIFTGNVNNVNEYMQIMDVFVLPSRFEGLPIVGVEAQAAGLPMVVSSNVSKELEITKNIVFVDVDDVIYWKEQIYKVLQRGREDTKIEIENSGFDIIKTSQQLEKLYLS